MKIWQRHFLSRLIQTFFFILVCLFLTYAIVDLSAHGVRFLSQSSLADVALYYVYTFASLLELFLSLAFLLAVMRVLFDLNAHREILALQMAGLSKKKLLRPFFLFAGFLSFIGYINSQWLAPDAQNTADAFKTSHRSKKKTERTHVHSIALEDESELAYQSYDPIKKELFDVFWVRTPRDIWHMKFFQIDSLRGHYVHHFTRNAAKQLEKSESYVAKDFSELPWNEETVFYRFIPLESRPISTLFAQACADCAERAGIFSHLYYKLLTPLMPFFVLLAISPISLRFSRNQPLFLIAAAALFSLIALKIILDGMLILGENQVLPASLAILGPGILAFFLSLPSFARMR